MLFSFFFFPEKVVIAKSTIILDVKPWDDETDMAEVEKLVRGITMDGLRWNACKWNDWKSIKRDLRFNLTSKLTTVVFLFINTVQAIVLFIFLVNYLFSANS